MKWDSLILFVNFNFERRVRIVSSVDTTEISSDSLEEVLPILADQGWEPVGTGQEDDIHEMILMFKRPREE